MNIKIIFSIIAVIIGLAASLFYIKDIIALKTKPHIYTWLIWAITQGTAAAGVWHGGGSWGALGLTVGAVVNVCVVLLCLKYGTKNITRSDTIILLAALAAIFVWQQLDQPLLSVIMVTLIDLAATVPTFRKSLAEPQSESLIAWAAFIATNIFSVLALSSYSLITLAYLVTIILADAFIFFTCFFMRLFHQRHPSSVGRATVL